MLLDTNILIRLLAGDEVVLQRVAESESIKVPSIVLGELFYGAQKSGRRAENLVRVEQLASTNIVLPISVGTARFYGQIKERLRVTGRPIPENDVWIAALAREHDLPLVTLDGHFDHIPDLVIVRW